MEDRYGIGSSKMGVASELVKQVIQESNKALIEVYNGQVLVQALVLEWNHPWVLTTGQLLAKNHLAQLSYNLISTFNGLYMCHAMYSDLDKSAVVSELAKAYYLLRPYLMNEVGSMISTPLSQYLGYLSCSHPQCLLVILVICHLLVFRSTKPSPPPCLVSHWRTDMSRMYTCAQNLRMPSRGLICTHTAHMHPKTRSCKTEYWGRQRSVSVLCSLNLIKCSFYFRVWAERNVLQPVQCWFKMRVQIMSQLLSITLPRIELVCFLPSSSSRYLWLWVLVWPCTLSAGPCGTWTLVETVSSIGRSPTLQYACSDDNEIIALCGHCRIVILEFPPCCLN